MSLILLLACAVDPREAYRRGIAPETPLLEALESCELAGESADECLASAVGNHSREATAEQCEGIVVERWRAECYFALGEAASFTGDRWGALAGCGQAGRYYDECLYHAWTFELQRAADGSKEAVDGIEKARPVVAFWSQIETVSPNPLELLWADWWFVAHGLAKPARLSSCERLPPADQPRCQSGTQTYVRRTVAERLFRPDLPADVRDRICRGDVESLRSTFPNAWVPDPLLDSAALEGRDIGCSNQPSRPWNPSFHPRALPTQP